MKLNYKILGSRLIEGDEPAEAWDIEWTHADGPVKDYHTVPLTHPPDIKYEERVAGTRDVVKDQINCKPGTPQSIVMQMCEEKRKRLADNLRVEA